jgi:sigma-B regulation protein RsbU (phosphoserine phosphatase)
MSVVVSAEEIPDIAKLREQDLEEARIIQDVMLPAHPLREGRVTISHAFQPMLEVGGDYLDYFLLSDGKIGLYLGDVSGKGLPAALYAALAVGTLRGVHKTGQSPSRVLSLLNERLLLRGIPGCHSAIQYAVFDPVTSRMQISSAGMPGPLLLRDRECSVLKVAGIPPGLFSEAQYDEISVELQHGDSLFFCTDGLTEARSNDDREFELEGVQEICRCNSDASPVELLGRVFASIEKFTAGCKQWDDMTAAAFHLAPIS